MACEVGLYYVLHITKQRNKNALLRLLPGLGESRGRRGPAVSSHRRPRLSPQPAFAKSHLNLFLRGERRGAPQVLRPLREPPLRGGEEAASPGSLALPGVRGARQEDEGGI